MTPSCSTCTNCSFSAPSHAMKNESKTTTTPNVTPSTHGAQDIQAMNARNELLEQLYLQDGRDNPDHPLHATYTGLYPAHLEKTELP